MSASTQKEQQVKTDRKQQRREQDQRKAADQRARAEVRRRGLDPDRYDDVV